MLTTDRPAPAQTDRPNRHVRSRRWQALLSSLFGLGCALAWHFIHLAGETYAVGPASLDFWFHLAVEGVIALYAAGLFLIFYNLLTWSRPVITGPDDTPQ